MKKQMLIVILIVLGALVAGCTQVENAKVTDITAEQLNEMMKSKDFTLIDVHIPEQEHIKGTDALIPYNEIKSNLDKLPEDKNAKIVIYCRSGSMSKEATQELLQQGYTNVYNLVGGRNDWVAKGFGG